MVRGVSAAIREPQPADVGAVAALHVAAWRETYGHLLPEEYFTDEVAERRRRMWTQILSDPRPEHVVRVAELDGELIGFAMSGESDAGGRQLYMLYVLAAHHGTGAGQALFDAVLAGGPASLWVARENPRAIAFYRRNGFAFDGAEQSDPATPGIVEARMVR
ncbi:GNAT family N-acetyltransferase [Microbacterium sp. 179-I 1D1 NHS]|uniref:N-acetyltransferase family protein n=1 Tax=Microbacterium sp. 179-I 1D1 NHS TaxID=3374298 RepID=UPI003879DFC8